MQSQTSKPVITKMNKVMMNQIKTMGFEDYIAKVHSKQQAASGLKVLGYAFFVGAVAIAIPFLMSLAGAGEDWPSWAPMAFKIGGAVAILVGLLVYFTIFSPAKRKRNREAYKERLNARHGDYKAVLKDVEAQLEPPITQTQCRSYITNDWVIIMDTTRPVSFTNKTEIAGLIGTNSGTVLVWDDGEFDTNMFFGNNTWGKVFNQIAEKNPYILTNRDYFENNKGQVVSIGTTTQHFARKDAENGVYVAKQFAKNKEAGVLPVWHKK